MNRFGGLYESSTVTLVFLLHLAISYADHFGCAGGTFGEHAAAHSQTSGLPALHQLRQPCSHSAGTLQTQYNGPAFGEANPHFSMYAVVPQGPHRTFRIRSSSTRGTTSCISKWSSAWQPSWGPVLTKWDFNQGSFPKTTSSLLRTCRRSRLWRRSKAPKTILHITYWWLM